MILTKKQEEGLKIALERHANMERYTVISGYAGTGKSTLVRFIIEALGVDEKRVAYAAFTGKAAEVLRKKGNKNACTLHKLLYDHFPKPAGGFFRKPKPKIDYDVVVVDEVSMAPKALMELLLKHKCYVICLGDPFQIPPIDKDEDNHLLDHPHIFLDEVMRQAQESEIIRLTMDIRAGKEIPFNDKGKEVLVLPRQELTTGMLTWADQVLVGTNATRLAINNQMRSLYGFEGGPQEGEKVICLRNYWETISEDEQPLVNGTIGYLKNSFTNFLKIPAYVTGGRLSQIDTVMGDFCSDDGVTEFKNLTMDKKMILEGEPTLNWKEAWKLSNNKKYMNSLPLSFTYGYAITAHKSQGSEWDNVLVIEEGFPFDKEEHKRWLYTACTRAAKKLVIIRKG
jgi:exodeoxyribonuclease-5